MRRGVGRGTRLLAAFVGSALLVVALATAGRGGPGTLEMLGGAAFCFFLAWTGFDLRGGSRRAQNRRFGDYGAMIRRRIDRR